MNSFDNIIIIKKIMIIIKVKMILIMIIKIKIMIIDGIMLYYFI